MVHFFRHNIYVSELYDLKVIKIVVKDQTRRENHDQTDRTEEELLHLKKNLKPKEMKRLRMETKKDILNYPP